MSLRISEKDLIQKQLYLEKMKFIREARRSFEQFVYFTKPDYKTNWHHKLMMRKLQDFAEKKILRLMIFTAPRHGKSELVSRRLPAFILGQRPDDKIIATSYGDTLASSMNRDVQRIIDSPEYAKIFPETRLKGSVASDSKGTWLRNNDIFEIVDHRGYYLSSGIGGGITGRGATYAIIDDPLKNWKDANSKTNRDNQWEWLNSTLMSRLDENDSSVLMTLTRWHEDDLAGRLIQEMKDNPEAEQWEILNLPAILEIKTKDDPRNVGEALWPEKLNLERLNKIKAVSPRVFASLYQQKPAPLEGNIINPAWWRFYREPPSMFDRVIQSWDLSFEEGEDHSYVVGQVWGKKGINAYLLYQYRQQVGFNDTIKAIAMVSALYPKAGKKIVENKANGPGVRNYLENKIPGIVKKDVQGSKTDRLLSVSPFIQSGNVYLPDPKQNMWVLDFISEYANFPNAGDDDQVDAGSQALDDLFSGESDTLRKMLTF